MSYRALLLRGCALGAVFIVGVAASDTTTYTYDALGRLIGTSVSGGASSGRKNAFCYDAGANRTTYYSGTGTVPACASAPTPTPTPTPAPAPTPTPTPTPTPANHPPVAVADSARAIGCTAPTIPVLANDYDPDGDAIHIVSVSSGIYGYGEISGSSIIYNRSSSNAGTDSLLYTIADVHGATASASITVTVEGHVNC